MRRRGAGRLKVVFLAVFMLLSGLTLSVAPVYAASFPYLQYLSGINTTSPPPAGKHTSNVIAQSIYDTAGNHYLAGTLFTGTYTIDPSIPDVTVLDNTAYVTKYNSDGSYAWTKYVYTAGQGVGRSYASSIAVNNSGNLYWSGVYNGVVTLDGQGGSHTVSAYIDSANNQQSAFMMKLSAANGNLQWVTNGDTSSGGSFSYGKIALTASGDVYSAGYILGTVALDSASGSNLTSSQGFFDGYILAFDASGVPSVVQHMAADAGGSDTVFPTQLLINSAGDMVVVGHFYGSIAFGPGGANRTATGTPGGFVAAYGSGGFEWGNLIDNGSSFFSAAWAADGGIAVGGLYGDGAQLTGLTTPLSTQNDDGIVVKYGLDGSYQWHQVMKAQDGASFAEVDGVAVDSQGNIYAAGDYSGTILIGTQSFATVSGVDGATCVSRYSPDGTLNWSDTISSDPVDLSQSYFTAPDSIQLLSDNTLEMVGPYSGNIVFNNADGTTTTFAQAAGPGFQTPYFLVRLKIAAPPTPTSTHSLAITTAVHWHSRAGTGNDVTAAQDIVAASSQPQAQTTERDGAGTLPQKVGDTHTSTKLLLSFGAVLAILFFLFFVFRRRRRERDTQPGKQYQP